MKLLFIIIYKSKSLDLIIRAKTALLSSLFLYPQFIHFNSSKDAIGCLKTCPYLELEIT